MADGLVCPYCDAPLFRSEIAGGRCATCARALPEHIAGPREAIRDGEEFARRPCDTEDKLRRYDPRYRNIRLGVRLCFAAVLVNLISIVVGICGGHVVAAFGMAGTVLLYFLGSILYCTMPPEWGGRGWAVVGLACILALASMVVGLLVFESRHFGDRLLHVLDDMHPAVTSGMFSLLLLGELLLLGMTLLAHTFVLQAIARYWDDDLLARNLMSQFLGTWIGVGVVVTAMVLLVLGAMTSSNLDLLGGGLVLLGLGGIASAIYFFSMMIWHLTLLGRVANVIPRASSGERQRVT